MYEEDQTLAEQCERLARETALAGDWLVQNKALVGRDLESHEKALRKAGRLMRSCAAAARRKMCAGVFGPSQAGKSYLVSTLAGNAEGKLWTQVGENTYDFLSEINPAGGKESTGLVTRFTLTKPAEAPAGYPVHARLLSVIDVVKILANTYFSDAEHMEAPDRDSMLATLGALEKRAGASPTGGMTADDVEDLQEYIHKYFRSKARVQQLLDQHFWARVIPLAPLLGDADRAELFGLIWDGIAPFTDLLRALFTALRALNFAPEAFCRAKALIPRENSIIDVATLGVLAPDQGDRIELSTKDGASAALPRVHVAALTAELVISMRDKAADFFEHTDLLDFPGYRSRKMFVDLGKEAEEPAKLKECFLRGKVAYLFERYCAERELTALLLCIGSGVQEVQGLGGAVNDWIAGTHGGTPERRAGKANALFFILTKSDLEFEDKAGAKDVSERWDTRMYASMEIFASHEWLRHWDAKGPFANFFLMRNPTVKLHLFNHDADGHESSLKSDMSPYVKQFEDAFMQSRVVSEHFAHKRESWQAFLAPNDGGLSLIREKLTPICKPELKRQQIRTTVEESLAAVRDRLRPYRRTDDKEQERKEKSLLGQNLARIMLGLAKARRFGAFARSLTVRDQDIYDLYFQAQYQMQAELAAMPTAGAAVGAPARDSSVDDMLADLLGEEALIAPDTPAPQGRDKQTPPRDEAQAFGEHIEKYWLDKLRAMADEAVMQQYFSFTPELFSAFVHEIGKGFVRLGARLALEESLRKASRYANVEKERLVWKQAGLAADVVNTYTDWLGFDPRSSTEQERTVSFGPRRRTLFTPPPEILPGKSLPVLAEDPADYVEDFAMDWSAALMHLVNENVNFDGVRDFDPEANAVLKKILDALCIDAGA
ncbi:MAG: putative virulence factor [Desulfovibrio sp.]|nr:putative virulence factor [Desulfovibrio sp.]